MNSLALVPDPASTEVAARDSVATAAHLLDLLEKQPTCLIRVGLDGVLLATNDAALSLLGATQLGQVLGTSLTERLGPAHRVLWCDFADRVWRETSGSLELDMVDLSGADRTVLVQAIALADHPDGIRSVLAAVRDVSATRHLEVTLQELETTLPVLATANQLTDELRAQLEEMRAQLEAALAERTDTARAMDALSTQLEQSIAERQRLETAARQDKADRQRLESVIEQRDADGRQLQSALDESLADRQEFESSLKQREANRQRLLAEHATARVRIESSLAEAASHNGQLTQLLADQGLDLQRTGENARRLEALAAASQLALDTALAAREETEQAIDALRTQLDQSSADRVRLETAIEQRDADHRRLETAIDQRGADFQRLETAIEQRDADVQRLETTIEQRDAERRQLQSRLDESLAERQDFESAVKQRAANRQRLLAEHASARVRVENALAEAASRNEQLTELLSDQGLSLQRTEENTRRLEALAGAGQLALDAALAERAEASQSMDILRTRLEHSSAERLELETAADRGRADRLRLESMIEQGEADRQRLESTIEQGEADRQRLESTIEQRDADRQQLQSAIDESLAERHEFESAVKQRAANRQRLLSEHATARVRAEGALAEATSRTDQLTKLLADQGLDLQRTEENARRLESLAAAGRVALGVARELQTIVGELDARTKDLLAECPLEADERGDIEGFRSAAIRAVSLARQIVQSERPV